VCDVTVQVAVEVPPVVGVQGVCDVTAQVAVEVPPVVGVQVRR